MTLPQLSVPRAGHSLITMNTTSLQLLSGDSKDVDMDSEDKSLMVFGGGDNERNFYSDVTTVSVKELLSSV